MPEDINFESEWSYRIRWLSQVDLEFLEERVAKETGSHREMRFRAELLVSRILEPFPICDCMTDIGFPLLPFNGQVVLYQLISKCISQDIVTV